MLTPRCPGSTLGPLLGRAFLTLVLLVLLVWSFAAKDLSRFAPDDAARASHRLSGGGNFP